MASSDQQPPVADTNGLMPIVFSYSGSLFIGGGNDYGYSNKGSNANVLSAYQNFALSQALAPIKTAMNSNTSPCQQGLNAALSLWLSLNLLKHLLRPWPAHHGLRQRAHGHG